MRVATLLYNFAVGNAHELETSMNSQHVFTFLYTSIVESPSQFQYLDLGRTENP